ncbi:MAG: Hsp20/alpha crystallin family protein [Carboxydocellales bacterium]|jgi:HSP20 family protein
MGELIPFDSAKHMSVIRKKMDALFEELFTFGDFSESSLFGLNSNFSIEVEDPGREIIVKAHLPGIDIKNLDIHVEENLVTIIGSFAEETRQESQEYLLQEQRAGAFIRSVPLNEPVNPEKSQAKFKDGLLEIKLPKSGGKSSRGVKIHID